MKITKSYLDNKELSILGEFYSRVFLFDMFNNEELRKKHYSFSINEWETFMFDLEILVEELRNHLMEAILYGCKCEFRHFGYSIKINPNSKNYHGDRNKVLDDFIKNCDDHGFKFSRNRNIRLTDKQKKLLNGRYRFCLRNVYNRHRSCDLLNKLFLPKETEELMYIILSAFDNYEWEKYYGGQKWADGVRAWFRLKNAKSLKNKIVAIDHAYDLQHNCGLLLNKDKRYENIEEDVNRYLNRKRYAKNLSEILYCPYFKNQHITKTDIFCYPRSHKTILKFGNKMGVLV